MKTQNIYPLSRGGWRTIEWQVFDQQWNAATVIDSKDTAKLNAIISKIKDKMPTTQLSIYKILKLNHFKLFLLMK